MKLTVKKRESTSKTASKRMRREGNMPAVVYSEGKAGDNVEVKGDEYAAALRQIVPGHLSTTVFTLVYEDGKEHRALIKDVQYHTTTYQVLHLDFEEIKDDVKVNVNIPIDFTGMAECSGIKLGGVLRPVIRRLRVRCLPKDMPASFGLDVTHMEIKHAKRLSEIDIPASVTPLVDLNEVAVVIAKR